MPSAKILESKKAFVAELNTKITGSLAGVVVAYNGISVENDTKLRKDLREAGVEYMVVKNTMLRRAVAGTAYEGLTEYFKGCLLYTSQERGCQRGFPQTSGLSRKNDPDPGSSGRASHPDGPGPVWRPHCRRTFCTRRPESMPVL